MSVYFVYRCPSVGPAGKHLKRFEDDTVLDWFRHHWERLAHPTEAYERTEELLGCHVSSFADIFLHAAEGLLPPPSTVAEMAEPVALAYVTTVLCDSPHLIQVSTDDDEVWLGYYFFDDHFLREHRAGGFSPPGRPTVPGRRGAGRLHDG